MLRPPKLLEHQGGRVHNDAETPPGLNPIRPIDDLPIGGRSFKSDGAVSALNAAVPGIEMEDQILIAITIDIPPVGPAMSLGGIGWDRIEPLTDSRSLGRSPASREWQPE